MRTSAATAAVSVALDNTAPRVTSIERQSPSSSPTNANSLIWRVTFSENVANVDQADFTVSGTTAALSVSEVTASTVYDVTATGGTLNDLTATVTLGFANNQNITDTATNALSDTAPTGTNHNSYVVDNTRPTVTITDVPPTSSAAFTATFTFLEAVTGFAVGDITLGNATAANFAVTSTTVYTALVTPTADGTVTVDVSANAAQDLAGNGNTAAVQVSSSYTVLGICGRTVAVQTAILGKITGVTDCALVTELHLVAITGDLNLFSGVTALQSGDFAGLTALTGLDLGSNDLAELPAGVFAGLSALTSLNLRDNELTELPAGVFAGLSALRRLNLTDNSLTKLPAGVFDDLSALTLLNLRDNELTALPDGVFEDLSALTTLTLSGNPGAPFAPTAVAAPANPAMVPSVGGTVTLSGSAPLSGNPWGANVAYEWALTNPAGVIVTFADAMAATTTVTIPAQTAGTVLTFTLGVAGRGSQAASQTATTTVTVTPTVTLALSDASISENGGASTVTATVSPALATAFTVTVSAAAVSPAVAADFSLSTNTTLSFAANATASTGTVTITGVNNTVDAADKTVTVSGTVTASGVTAPAAVTLTIEDDDPNQLRIQRLGGTISNDLCVGLYPTPADRVGGRICLGVFFTSPGMLTQANVEIENGAIAKFSPRAGSVQRMEIDVDSSGEGDFVLRIPQDVMAGGNTAAEFRRELETPPTLTMSTTATAPVTGNFLLRLQFSESVAAAGAETTVGLLSIEDGPNVSFLCTNCSLVDKGPQGFSSVMDDTRITIGPRSNFEGTLVVALPANRLASVDRPDLNYAPTSFEIEVDTLHPRVSSIIRQVPSDSPANADELTWRVTFSETVKNVDSTDFTITGAGDSAALTVTVVDAEAGVYDVKASGGTLANLDATVTLGFAPGRNIADTAGNALSNSAGGTPRDDTWVVDNTAPGFVSGVVNGASLALTWSEDLDPASVPAPGAFAVVVGQESPVPPDAVELDGAMVILTLPAAVIADQQVTASYSASQAGAKPLRDPAGNEVASAENTNSYAVTNETPISPPGNLRTEPGDGRVRLTWTAPAHFAGIKYYQIRHAAGASVADDTAWTMTLDQDNLPANLTALVSGLANGAAHTFEVRAVRGSDRGAVATVSATPAPAACSALDLGARRQVWRGTMTVGRSFNFEQSSYGFGRVDAGYFNSRYGSLPSAQFQIAADSYTISQADTSIGTDGSRGNPILFDVDPLFSGPVRAALQFHWCDESAGLPAPSNSLYRIADNNGADWSLYGTRELALSLPPNNDATGTPAVTGTARTGAILTAAIGDIADTDGLPTTFPDDYTVQWLRVDADGVSNPANIMDATSVAYTLTSDDVGKRVKARISFFDQLGGEEVRDSALISNNLPTVANAIPDQSATEDTEFNYTFPVETFNDADGDTLTYMATKADNNALPTWLTFSDAMRTFSGTPAAADVETVSVKVTANDVHSGSVSDTFDIMVSEADSTAPTVTSIKRQTPTSSPTNADTLTWRVTFSEAVENVDTADFTVTGTNAGLMVMAVATETGVYDLTVAGGNLADLDATSVTLAFAASQNIQDTAGNKLMTTLPSGTNHSIWVVNNPQPGPPASLTAVAGDGRVRLVWAAPADANNTATYQVRHAAGAAVPSATAWTGWTDQFVITEARTLVVSGLTNGTAHAFELRALHGNDAGPPATVSATPATAVCNAPDLGARREVWSGTMTVGRSIETEVGNYGIGMTNTGFDAGEFGSLSSNVSFQIGAETYNISEIYTTIRRDNGRFLWVDFTGRSVPGPAKAVLDIHSCGETRDFSAASLQNPPEYQWSNLSDVIDFSLYTTRELALSLPPNNDATGTPTVTGTARSGATLTAAIGNIADTDGLPATYPDNYTFQWVRVDTDGVSNPVVIADADADAYTLTDADVGKRVKARIGFFDQLGGAEARDSAASAVVAVADTVPPTVTITGVPDPSKAPFTATFTFSEPVTGFTENDITLGNATASNFMTTSATVYTALITPTANGTVTVDVAANAAQDLADNGSTVATRASSAYTRNNPPTTTSVSSVSIDEDTQLVLLQNNFFFADIDMGDTLSSVKILTLPDEGVFALAGTEIMEVELPKTVAFADLETGKLRYNPPADRFGITVNFDFKVNDGTDDSVAKGKINIRIDAVNDPATGQPGITGTPTVGQVLTATAGDIADVEELPDSFLTDANTSFQWVRVDAGDETEISGETDSTYTLITADAGKTIKVKVSFQDGGGSSEGPLSSAAYPSSGTVQAATRGVTIVISLSPLTVYPGGTNSYTVVLDSEPTGNVTITPSSDNTEVTLSPEALSFTPANWNMPLTVMVTAANNASSGSATITHAVTAEGTDYASVSVRAFSVSVRSNDTIAPTVKSIARQSPAASPTNAVRLTWRVTFSEPVTGVDTADFTVAGTTAGATLVSPVTGMAEVAYDVTVSGGNLASLTGTVTLSFAANQDIVDANDNALENTSPSDTNERTYALDNTAPTLTITGVPPISSAAFTATFTFLEAVTGFAVGDISLGNATASNFVAMSTTVYTALITPTADGTVTVDVPANAAQDAVGHGNTVATRASSTYTSNNPPTSADSTVTAIEDTDYTFLTTDFAFTDTDMGAQLSSVKIVSLPATGKGTLTLSNTVIMSENLPKTVPAAQIGNLKYSPPANKNGDDFTSFTFRVNDGTDDSATPNTVTIDVTAVNDPATGAPGITGTATVGQVLTATAGDIADPDGLPDPFLTDTNTTFQWVRVDSDGSSNPTDIQNATAGAYTLVAADEGKKIKVKVSFQDGGDGSEGPLTSAIYPSSGTVLPAHCTSNTNELWCATLTVGTTVFDSTAYTGYASGTNAYGGLAPNTFRYRTATIGVHIFEYDAGFLYFKIEEDSGTTPDDGLLGSGIYTLEIGAGGDKKSFVINNPGTDKTSTFSSPGLSWSSGDTVPVKLVRASNTAPTSAANTVTATEDTDYAFLATDFPFTDVDSGAFLRGVKIVTLPATGKGTLSLDGTVILAEDLPQTVTTPDLDTINENLKYSPPANKNGDDFTSFTFRVNDGAVDSATHTLTIDVTAVNDPATGAPGITGTATVGQVLTATVGNIADVDGLPNPFLADADTTFKWVRVATDNTEESISGATASTYTLVTDDLGTTIKVEVRFTDNASTTEMRTSAATAAVSVALDNTAPRVTSIERQSPSSSPTNANSLIWRVTFSENVANVDQADFTVSGTTAALSVSEVTASTVYDVTATGGTLNDLTATVTLGFANNQNITDTATNALSDTAPTGTNHNSYVVDNTRPTVTITDVPNPSNAPFTATFTFPEPVTGFAGGDITVGNGAASAFAVTDPMTYTALITPAADGAVTVDVAADVATDVAGNGNSAAARVSSTYTMRSLSISVNNGSIAENGGTATLTVSVTVAFSTDQIITLVDSGTAGLNADYTLSNSLTLTLTAGSTSVTATITAQDDNYDDDAETIVITASHDGTDFGSQTVTITDDDDAPTFSITVSDDSPSEAAEPTVTLTVSLGGSAFEYPTESISFALSGTADEKDDYDIDDLQLIIPSDATEVSTTIYIINDDIFEGDETIIITASHDGTDFGSQTITITDHDDDPNTPATGAPTITGTARVGQVLTATAGDIADVDGLPDPFLTDTDTSFQWVRVATDSTEESISGATASTYTLVTDDLGTKIKVEVRFTDNASTTEMRTSAATAAVSAALETTAPRVTSIERHVPASTPTNANTLIWRVTFSEPVLNVDTADFTVSGTTATVTAVSAAAGVTGAYDVTASGGNLNDRNATVTLSFAVGQNITDAASNALSDTAPTGTNHNTYVVDNTAPTLTITGVPPTSSAAFTATFTFLEAVTGFAVGDITLGNATATNFAVTSTMVYTALITPTADGAVTVDVPANAAQDLAGNGNTVATRASSTYDATPPTLTSAATNAAGTQFTLTFSENVQQTNLPLATAFTVTADGNAVTVDSVAAGAAAQNLINVSPAIYRGQTVVITYTDPSGSNDAAALQDLVGNDVASFTTGISSVPTAINNSTVNAVPTLATAIPNQAATTGTSFSYTFLANTFSDANGDTLTYMATKPDNAALPTWLGFTAASRAFSGTPQAGDVGTVAVKVTANDGNGGTVSDTFNIEVRSSDTTPPTVTSIERHVPASTPTNANTLIWRVTFSEPVLNVDTADFTVSGTTATVTAVSAAAGVTGAYDVTASGGNLNDRNATVTLSFVTTGHGIADTASNALTDTAPTGTNHNSYVVDNTAPTLTITGVPPTSSAAFTATFTFLEPVTGFAVGDITLGNATAANFAVTSTTVYTALITPTADGAVTVDVPANAAQDLAGNGNTVATRASSTYDATPPTLTSAASGTAGTQITLTFSENVQQTDLPLATAFTVTADGNAVTVSSVAAGAAAQNLINVSPAIYRGQTVVITYTDPSGSNDAAALQDLVGNDVASFTTGISSVPAADQQLHRQCRPDAGDRHTQPGGDDGHVVQLYVPGKHVQRRERRHADLHGDQTGQRRAAHVAGLHRRLARLLGHAAGRGRGDGRGEGNGERRQWRHGQRHLQHRGQIVGHHPPDGDLDRAPCPRKYADQRKHPDLAGDLQRAGVERGHGRLHGERDDRHGDGGERGRRGDGRVRRHRERGQSERSQCHGHAVFCHHGARHCRYGEQCPDRYRPHGHEPQHLRGGQHRPDLDDHRRAAHQQCGLHGDVHLPGAGHGVCGGRYHARQCHRRELRGHQHDGLYGADHADGRWCGDGGRAGQCGAGSRRQRQHGCDPGQLHL